MHSNFVEIERVLTISINEELDNKLPIKFFEDFFSYLNAFLFEADICQLPSQLKTITNKIFDFVYNAQQGKNLRSSHPTCYRNVSEQMMEPFHDQLFNGLERPLYNIDLIFKAMKHSETLVKRIRSFHISSECIKPFTQLQYCAKCTGYFNFKPCLHFCLNVFRGCFADIADLYDDFQLMIRTLRDVPSDIFPSFRPQVFVRQSLQGFIDLARYLRARNLRTEVSTKLTQYTAYYFLFCYKQNIIHVKVHLNFLPHEAFDCMECKFCKNYFRERSCD